MELLLAKEAFESSKSSAIITFFDSKQQTAVDLLTAFVVHRAAVSPRAFVHFLCFERKPRFWKTRLEDKLANRIHFYDFWYDAFGWNDPSRLLEAQTVINAVQTTLKNPACSASSCNEHVLVFDASTLLLLTIPANELCLLLVGISDKLSEELGRPVTSSVAVLHHSDIFDEYSEKALKVISTSSISVASATQTPRHEKEFLCTITSKSQQASVLRKAEKIIVNSEWIPRFEKADLSRPVVAEAPRVEPDPTANIPFNLRLTEEQRAARSAVPLPHTKGAGVIYYEPDEADDIDYEDPDE
ncbi:elongator complex protein 5-like [Paramacrobiotus metropolitanus]|uniref:elongator complex protein 5-like n=1 Tax=Paramacrobiotus metropolitanus TaxID=2943436 RepID=UPI00244572C3|nr:elongator complex protein 5-like [Paramacrobiotus metropolitanus]